MNFSIQWVLTFKLLFKNSKVLWDSNFQSGSPLGSVWAHSRRLFCTPGNVNVILGLHSRPSLFHAPCIRCEPKVRVVTKTRTKNIFGELGFLCGTRLPAFVFCWKFVVVAFSFATMWACAIPISLPNSDWSALIWWEKLGRNVWSQPLHLILFVHVHLTFGCLT